MTKTKVASLYFDGCNLDIDLLEPDTEERRCGDPRRLEYSVNGMSVRTDEFRVIVQLLQLKVDSRKVI